MSTPPLQATKSPRHSPPLQPHPLLSTGAGSPLSGSRHNSRPSSAAGLGNATSNQGSPTATAFPLSPLSAFATPLPSRQNSMRGAQRSGTYHGSSSNLLTTTSVSNASAIVTSGASTPVHGIGPKAMGRTSVSSSGGSGAALTAADLLRQAMLQNSSR